MLIATGLGLLPDLLLRLFAGTGYNPFASFSMSMGTMGIEEAISVLGYLAGILLLYMLFSLLITPFIDAGFLSCLDSNKNEENHVSLFFNMGMKKYGKALGAMFLMILMIIVLGIGALIVSFLLSFLFMFLGEAGMILVQIIVLLAMLVGTIFLLFMIKDAVIGGVPVGGTIASSFKKVKKVFWPLFGLLILVSIVTYAFSSFLPGILATLFGIIIGLFAEVFLFYPLYKHASELVGDESQTNEGLEEGTTW